MNAQTNRDVANANIALTNLRAKLAAKDYSYYEAKLLLGSRNEVVSTLAALGIAVDYGWNKYFNSDGTLKESTAKELWDLILGSGSSQKKGSSTHTSNNTLHGDGGGKFHQTKIAKSIHQDRVRRKNKRDQRKWS